MQVPALTHISRSPDKRSRPGLSAAFAAGACVVGVGIVAVSSGSQFALLAIGVLALFGLAGAGLLVLDVPLIALVRFTFIASFFFKGDLMLFKVDEIEDPSGLNISLTLGMALCLLIYDQVIEPAHERVFSRSVTILFSALFLSAAASVVFAGLPSLGLFSLLSLLVSVFVAYVTVSHFGRGDRIKELVLYLGIGLIFTGLAAVSQYALDWPVNLSMIGTGTEEERLGTQSDLLSRTPAFLRTPNGMAWVVSSLIPLALAPVLCRAGEFRPSQRIVLFAAGMAGTAAVILSLARGSWAGLVVAIALLLLAGWYPLSTTERKGYLVTAFCALAFAGIMLLPFSGRIYDRLTEDDHGSVEIRLPLLETAARMIDDNALTGVGLNGYRSNMVRYDDTDIFVSQVFRNPVHNVFAHVTAEVGVPGGLVFCLLILAAFVPCVRSMIQGNRLYFAIGLGVAVGLIAFTISGMKEPASLGSARPPMRTFFLLLGVAFALERILRQPQAEVRT